MSRASIQSDGAEDSEYGSNGSSGEVGDKIVEWKNICFLPFAMLWKIGIVMVVFFEISLVSYMLMFETKVQSAYFLGFYYTFEIMYLIDTILLTAHKYLTNHQKKRTYQSKHYITLIIDILTLIPYYETYYLLGQASKGKRYNFGKDVLKWKVIPRIYRIPTFFNSISNTPGLNHIAAVTLGHMTYFLLYSTLGACLWYFMVWDSPDFNWAVNFLQYHNFNKNSSMSWYIISSNVIGNVFAHNWSGLIFGVRNGEFAFLIITMLLGFLNHYMILFGKLTALYMKKIGDQFSFSNKLYVTQLMMNDWNVPPKTQKEVIEIYNNIWEQRLGITEEPKMAKLLPKNLRRKISLDIFWTAFKHSPIFDDLNLAVKRHLSLYMKSIFLTPGESLLRTGEVKSRMIYIVSGVVQILSQEDQTSAVMSFSSGTLLGETNTLLPIVSNVNITCASYCEIHTLDYRTLWSILRIYRGSADLLKKKLRERLDLARLLQHPEIRKLKVKEKKTTDLRWIKSQWRSISQQTKGTSKKRLEEKHQTVTLYHTSKYLSLYVLSEDVELKVKTICLKSTFPCIFDPSSSFRKSFEYLVIVSMIMQTLLLPYMLFFQRGIALSTNALFYTLDGFYVLGVILDVSTAVKKSDRIISTFGQILIYKGKQISFLIDITATLPFELLGLSSDDPRFALLRVNRLLKFYKLFVIIKRAELSVWVHYIQIRTIKYLMIITVSTYILSAFSYGMTSFPEDNLNGWLFYNQGLEMLLKGKPPRELSHFWTSIEYVLTIILSQSWRSYFAYSAIDIFIELVITIIGYLIYSFCFAEVGACAVLSHQAVIDYQFYLGTLTNFANKRHIPNNIKYFMYSMVQSQWEYNGRYEVSGPKSIIRQLPENKRNEILTCRIVKVLRLSPIFFECDESVLWKVAGKMTINIFPPNTIIVQPDCFSMNLHVIIRGHCLAESHIPTDKYHEVKTDLTIGDTFPLLEMLMSIDSFLKVTAETYVEIAAISHKDMMIALDRESVFYADLKRVVEHHFEANKIILSRQKGRLPEMISAEKAGPRGDFFEYEINDEVVKLREVTYNTTVWKKSGAWRLMRHLFLKNTLNPRKKIYVTWECFRCTISAINVSYSLFFVHYIIMPNWHQYVNYFFLSVAILDFYIRMHCRFYNERGILITHPLYTAKHYFSTSFLLDFFCVLPFRELQIQNFFGSYRKYGLLILTLMTRPLLIYRIFNGISYLQKRSTGKAVLYHNVKYVMIVLVAIGIATAILEGTSCPRETESGEFSCPNNTWLYKDIFKEQESTYMTSLICYYVAISVFSTSTVGLFSYERKSEVLCMAFLSFMLLAIRWFMLAKITSSRIGGNTRLVHYQHNMKEFLKFSKKYYLKPTLVHETVSYYEYIWKRTKGSSINKILPSFHPVLREDFCAFFYEPTLKMTEILSDLQLNAVRHITPHFKEWHYKKDADIVRCNDVTDTIYIVHKGSVEIKIANDRLALLTQGGMFGSFDPKGMSRLTITAKAIIHVDLLVIDIKTFYTLISRYKTIKNRLDKNRLMNCEFFLPIAEENVTLTMVNQSKDQVKKSIWKNILMFAISSDSKWLSIYNYVLNVHISIISSLIIMTLIAKVGDHDIENYFYLGYIFDFVFGMKLLLEFHTTYIDQDSGVVIKKYSKIWRKHAKSIHFWYNIATTVPLEIITYFINGKYLYRYFWLNRILRFTHLIRYYNNCKNTLTVSKHLRWTYLMYSMIFLIHTNVCIWWKIACPNEICRYYPKVNHEPKRLVYTKHTLTAFRLSYIYVINVFTSTGLRVVVPTNWYELLTSIIMVGFSQLVMVVLTVGFASMLVLDKFEMTNFEKGARKVLKYLNRINLSLFLKRKVWKYYVEQWTKTHGQWLPVLIESSPSYLKEDIMQDLYAKHLLNHFLFRKTHMDFIRQLSVHLKLSVFLPGMYIVEKGDIDGCMYFIDEGEIVVYDVINKLEIEVMVLTQGASFGERNGLYKIPHERSYMARYTTKVLSLVHGSWEYLMDWFPASKEQIVEQSLRRFKPKSDHLNL